MSRSIWKGPFVHTKLFKNIKKINKKPLNAVTVETVSRCSEIIPGFIGTIFDVYNGKSFSKIEVSKEMVGFKLGEFSPTRKKFSFKKKKIK
jgi:small subunit ribosomal protein S19